MSKWYTFRIKQPPIIAELWIPGFALVWFFIFQAWGGMSELALTIFILSVSSLMFYWRWREGETNLYIIGIIAGTVIEVGFRYLGYQQTWNDASFFGVPYWLPVAWGMMFVLITRLGILVRRIPYSD